MKSKKSLKRIKNFMNKDVTLAKTDKDLAIFDTDTTEKTKKNKNIKDVTMEEIQDNPENFLEINVIRDTKIIETSYIFAGKKTFKYKGDNYEVDHDLNLHNPKGRYVIPTAFYKEGNAKPISFKNLNKGIPSKVLTLLYDTRLYRILIQPETGNLNWVLIIVTIIQIIMMGIIVWGLWNNGYLNF